MKQIVSHIASYFQILRKIKNVECNTNLQSYTVAKILLLQNSSLLTQQSRHIRFEDPLSQHH